MHQQKKKSHLGRLNKYIEQPKVWGCGRAGQASERIISSTCGGFAGCGISLGGNTVFTHVDEYW